MVGDGLSLEQEDAVRDSRPDEAKNMSIAAVARRNGNFFELAQLLISRFLGSFTRGRHRRISHGES